MLEAYALSDPGRVRSTNQDFFRILPDLGLYLLADGMGGARGGERASQLAVDAVAETLAESTHRDAAALIQAVEEANQRVLSEAMRDARLEGMGTTLVAVLETKQNELAIASVGEDGRKGVLCLRHAEAVRWAAVKAPRLLAASRNELLSELKARLEGRTIHERTAESGRSLRWLSAWVRQSEFAITPWNCGTVPS